MKPVDPTGAAASPIPFGGAALRWLLEPPLLFGTACEPAALAWALNQPFLGRAVEDPSPRPDEPPLLGEARNRTAGSANRPSSEGRRAGLVWSWRHLRRPEHHRSSSEPRRRPASRSGCSSEHRRPQGCGPRAYALRRTLRGPPDRRRRRGSSEPDARDSRAPCLRGSKPKGAPSGGLAATPVHAQRTPCRSKTLRLRDPPTPDPNRAATREEGPAQRQPTARGQRPR